MNKAQGYDKNKYLCRAENNADPSRELKNDRVQKNKRRTGQTAAAVETGKDAAQSASTEL